MLNKRAKHYGVDVDPAKTEYFKNLIQILDEKWIGGFNHEIFQLTENLPTTGVTYESMHLLEMMSIVAKDKKIGEKA